MIVIMDMHVLRDLKDLIHLDMSVILGIIVLVVYLLSVELGSISLLPYRMKRMTVRTVMLGLYADLVLLISCRIRVLRDITVREGSLI